MAETNRNGYTTQEGIDAIGAGWKLLVLQAFDKKPKNTKIVQVKEKYGALRIYAEPYDRVFDEFLLDLELQSQKICYECGIPAMLRNYKGIYMTLCDLHK